MKIKSNLTLAEIYRFVRASPVLDQLYQTELNTRKISCGKVLKVNGKKVGIQKFDLATKYAAQHVYLNSLKKN